MLSERDLRDLEGLIPALGLSQGQDPVQENIDLKQAETLFCFKSSGVRTNPPQLLITRGEATHSLPLYKDCDDRIFVRIKSGVWYGNAVFDVFLT